MLLHELQPPDPDTDVLTASDEAPLLEKLKAESSLSTSLHWHWGQHGLGSEERISSSNSFPHLEHRNSNIGIWCESSWNITNLNIYCILKMGHCNLSREIYAFLTFDFMKIFCKNWSASLKLIFFFRAIFLRSSYSGWRKILPS